MAQLPKSTLALPQELHELPHSVPTKADTKRKTTLVDLDTVARARNDLLPVMSHRNRSPSLPPAHLSTPPDSPGYLHLSAVSSKHPGNKYDVGPITPPPTPTSKSDSKTSSTFSDNLYRPGDAVFEEAITSTTERKFSAPDEPASSELLLFPHTTADYVLLTDKKGKKEIIGEGAWSSVYLARPTLLHRREPSPGEMTMAGTSPPLAPVHSRNPISASCKSPAVLPLYAIKAPAMTSANKVLYAEAKILSYLSRFPNARDHIVPFFGLDPRTGSLVLRAMDDTLESWIASHLNTLSESCRAAKLARIFPCLALSLIDSLAWMHEKDCIQADIKPSNILLSSSSSPSSTTTDIPKPVYTDFSSAILAKPGSSPSSTASVLGAGTWDYLDPKLLSSTAPAPLSPCTDLWSLAITLLYLVIGRSPYEAFKANNKYQQREMIKSGSPLQCLAHGDAGPENVRRLRALSEALRLDVQVWFSGVLVKDASRRVDLAAWRGMLVMKDGV